ncbi:DEAD/DEAH box helicase [Coraliomargarita sp. SDUM461003]|uniref:DEAD/DEAH box helicase n=1 Tax=Thalassobacterium maritimum TaxID=3041265 RepID=A0ABU1AYK4_9BACT|nr:DEAD/DEAH box helicase [Coraliomargarita sp. SDUM461003]MDQ8209215.1 DEAD/DEAH box helicase [Coraliomargarita sp. SDUM461003]
MSSRLSSRVYNTAALEVWFNNVGLDWEQSFARETLRRGREIYRQGQISGVELADDEAIVHCQFARKDTCYAVIEWTAQGPKVRSSIDDDALGEAVAVGGIYEIEELIADEIDPLPYEPKPAEAEQASEDTAESEPEVPVDDTPARRLTPQLEGLRSGLRLTAYWVNEDFSREPAFRSDGVPMHSSEREILVRLTAKARESGFQFRRESNDYILYDPERIAPFFSHTLKRWENVFSFIDLDLEAQRMAEGVREVKVIGRVESAGKEQMRVDWRLKLGRQWLDPEDAERLAKAGRGTHVVRGLGLVRIGEEQSAALAEWRVAAATNQEAAQTWPRYMVFSLFSERGAELDLEEELSEWRNHLLEQDCDDEKALPEFLRDYQAQGVRWMAKLRELGCHGLLADEMGLGKTLQVLTLLQYYPHAEKDSLIVCPASVVPVWESEARRWYPEIQTEVLSSGNDFSQKSLGAPRLWIASYTQLRRHKHLLDAAQFGYAVLDEAQQIKNPDAKVTQACCSISAECRLALTGTPIENRLLDLWTLFRFLMPGLLGSRRRFEEALDSENTKFRDSFVKRLRQQLTPFILRRQKDKVGKDLPPKVEMDLICPITALQRQTYENLLDRGRDELGDDLQSAMQTQSMHFFSLLTRLRQACCDPGLIPEVHADIQQSGKIQMLLTRLEDALSGDGARKVVIFSQFVSMLKRLKPLLKEAFPKVALLELSGRTKNRSKPVDTFQQTKGPAVILVSLRAGGTGITLHAADYVFLLDPWWNPAVESQAVDRVHRIGQDRRVFVYRMITQGTIEERIQHLKKEKRELFESTLGHLGSAKDLAEHFGDLEELAKLLPPES